MENEEQTPQTENPSEAAERPDPAEDPDGAIAEPLPDEDESPTTREPEGSGGSGSEVGTAGSGERPSHPAEGTSPPGNQDPDPGRLESAREDIERAGAN
jgi:hypothetical protein